MHVSATDRSEAADDDSAGGSTHSQAFLQQRVALFALAGLLLGLTFLVFRVGSSLAAGRLSLVHPSMITHVIGMATYFAVWLIARRGHYALRTIRGLENAAIILTAVFYTAMAAMLPIGFRPDFVMILCLNLVVMTRSILVPSTTRRTTIVAAVVGTILIVGAYRAFAGAARIDSVSAGRLGPGIVQVTASPPPPRFSRRMPPSKPTTRAAKPMST